MKKEDFRFEVLTENNKNTWLDIAKKCSYAPVNVLDEFFLDEQLKNNSAEGNIIIYEQKNNIPIALFPGVIEKRRRGLISLKILRSAFGGLLIDDSYGKDILLLKNFVFRQIINKYYTCRLRIDLVEVELPPKIIIDSYLSAFKMVPFYWSNVEVNSILYLKIDNDLLGKLKPSVKREVKAGLKNIKNAQIADCSDKNILDYLVKLNKHNWFSSKPDSVVEGYFRRILKSPYYYASVILLDGEPVTGVICSLCNGIGTYRFNSSDEIGKKLFMNKALLYLMIEDLKSKGANYFILGLGMEYDKEYKSLDNLNYFKRSFSSDEVSCFRFRRTLSFKAYFLEFFKRWKAKGLL